MLFCSRYIKSVSFFLVHFVYFALISVLLFMTTFLLLKIVNVFFLRFFFSNPLRILLLEKRNHILFATLFFAPETFMWRKMITLHTIIKSYSERIRWFLVFRKVSKVMWSEEHIFVKFQELVIFRTYSVWRNFTYYLYAYSLK